MRKKPEYGLGRIIDAIKPAVRWPLEAGFFIAFGQTCPNSG
jgi:hypothetical protein